MDEEALRPDEEVGRPDEEAGRPDDAAKRRDGAPWQDAPVQRPLPVLPGFREMALRRMSEDRRRLVGYLAGQRRAAGISQTEVAARMRTSQSAVARLEAGESDVRASTLERYAAAIGCEIGWQFKQAKEL
jgi:ribosome-binding protein aMBF1 (putative translation factor)